MKIIDAHLHVSSEPYFDEIAREAGHINSTEHLREQFARHEIVHGVVMAGNRSLRPELHAYPDFLSYCVGIHSEWLQPHAVGETAELVEQHLLWERCAGIKLYPGYEEYSVADPICDPLYELAHKYDKPVAVHTGFTAAGDTSEWCHPDTIGEAAVRWPGVQLVMCHMGNPWLADAVAVMRRCPNVAADLSGILEGKAVSLAALLDSMGTFVHELRSALRGLDDYSRILYGTDWPLANIADYIGFVENLIPPEHRQAVFHDNAVRIYQLEV